MRSDFSSKNIRQAAHPPPHAARSEKIKKKSRDSSTCLGATQVSVYLESVQGFLDFSARPMGVAS